MIGMMMSLTSESTILPKAAPMMTPIARSTTLPRIAKSLNSLSIEPPSAVRKIQSPPRRKAQGKKAIRAWAGNEASDVTGNSDDEFHRGEDEDRDPGGFGKHQPDGPPAGGEQILERRLHAERGDRRDKAPARNVIRQIDKQMRDQV